MKITKCRNCSHKKLIRLFSLGKLSFTGKFYSNGKKVKSDYLKLIMCKECKLVQLDRNFNLKYLYNNDYGYRSGINKTMSDHLKNIVKNALKKIDLKGGDLVLDIASNDGTLLNYYKKNLIRVGVDPILKKYLKNYKNINYKFSNFFDLKILKHSVFKKKFKIITALSVFYDLNKPNAFLRDVTKILHKDGLFILEFADLKSIIKNNIFDTICHEHLEYYSVKVLNNMLKKHNMKILDYRENKINGGSKTFFINFINSKPNSIKNLIKIRKCIKNEIKLGLNDPALFQRFFKNINKIGKKINQKLSFLKNNNKTIHGYGASTKGNVLIQYFNLKKFFDYICDRNPNKFNLRTPGSNIKIISEEKSRLLNPDYYFVLPWHFKTEILKREKKIRNKGTKFIFPLPKFKTI